MDWLWNFLGALLGIYASIIQFSVTGQIDVLAGIWKRRWLWIWLPLGILLTVLVLNLVGSVLGFVGHPLASRVIIGIATVLLVGLLLAWWLTLVGLAKWLKLNIDLVEKPLVEWGLTAGKDIVLALLKATGLALEDIKLGKLSLVDQEAMVKKVASTRQMLIAAALCQAVLFMLPCGVTFALVFLSSLLIFALVNEVREFEWDATGGRLLLYRFNVALLFLEITITLTWVVFPETMDWILVGAGQVDQTVLRLVSHPVEPMRRLFSAFEWNLDPAQRVCDLLALVGIAGYVFLLGRLIRRIMRLDPRFNKVKIEEAKEQKELAEVRGEKWPNKTFPWVRVILVVAVLVGATGIILRYRGDLSEWVHFEEKPQTSRQSSAPPATAQPAPSPVREPARTAARPQAHDAQGLRELDELEQRFSWLR